MAAFGHTTESGTSNTVRKYSAWAQAMPRSTGSVYRRGCQDATAELLITRRFLQPRLYTDPVDLGIACAQAEYFLTVFDVPDSVVWPNAALGR